MVSLRHPVIIVVPAKSSLPIRRTATRSGSAPQALRGTLGRGGRVQADMHSGGRRMRLCTGGGFVIKVQP